MEPQKVFEEMNNEPQMSGKVVSWLLSLLMVICIGMFGFLWQISKSMAVLEDHDTQRSSDMGKMQADINQLRFDMSELKINQATLSIKLQSIQDAKK